MKLIVSALTMLLLICSTGFAESSSSSSTGLEDGSETSPNTKIVIPDIKFSIEDESEVPLRVQDKSTLKDSQPDYGKINMDELSRSKVSDKFKTELKDERRREDFSLSAFKFYYGRYENLLADINIGKKTGNLNYLISYLRNKRASVGHDTNLLFNTEMEVDDLYADFIYSITTNVDLSANFGYYVRDIGLYTNPYILNENKINIPAKLGFTSSFGANSLLRGDINFNFLKLNQKYTAFYDTKNLWDSGLDLSYDMYWGRDNFLKATGKYTYFNYQSDILHFGRISFTDRFPILSSFSLQAGADVSFYSYKNVFWFPTLLAVYKYSNILSFKAGITGDQNNTTIERYMKENQLEYQRTDPDEKWIFTAGASYSPVQIVNFRGALSYQAYSSMVNYGYNASNDMYFYRTISNTGLIQLDAAAEYLPVENFIISASYSLKLPLTNDLYFVSTHTAGLNLDYQNTELGLGTGTRIAYMDSTVYRQGLTLAPSLIWDINLTKTINRDIIFEIKLNNLLNQIYFEKPDIPGGGFSFNGGIRVLL